MNNDRAALLNQLRSSISKLSLGGLRRVTDFAAAIVTQEIGKRQQRSKARSKRGVDKATIDLLPLKKD